MNALLTWLKGEFAWLVLLAVGAAAAYLYVDLRTTRADRDALQRWATVTCAATGAGYPASTIAATTTDGKAVAIKHAAGDRCAAQVAGLVQFKAAVGEESARAFAAAMADHDLKTTRDIASAAAAAAAARDAAARMENVDAQVPEDDRVDGNWFAALNGLGGLRKPDD